MNTYKAYIYEIPANQNQNGYFLGESPDIKISTNVAELQGQLVEFYGCNKEEVTKQIIAVLKMRGLTGKLKVI